MTKILYVEDEPFLAKIVKESLESRGYEIKHLTSGEHGAEVIKIWKPDLCVLDVMLPSVDGFTLAKEIREENLDLPIIFLTAKDQSEDVVHGFKLGGNDYVKKPFSMEELILRIENLLRLIGKKETLNNEINWGSYTYRPAVMTLQHNGEKPIQLSHRENEILTLFAKHQNQKLERKKILLDIWGDDSFFNSRNLDVYIRKLRKHFSQDLTIKIITLKGVGYHFYVESI